MEAVGLVVDKLKGFAKASQGFVTDLIHQTQKSARRNPIEILKRLQREAFSDLMKLRDRQDKVERMISFYGSSKGSSFRQTGTHVIGEVDVLGAIFFIDKVDQQNTDVVSKAGIRTGIDSRFTFETIIRERDTLTAQFVASEKGKNHISDVLGSVLSLSKVCYTANISDWLSVNAIPVGAQCRDIGNASNSSQLGKGLTDISSFGPPMMIKHNGRAIGLSVRKSNVVTSLAQFVSEATVDQCFTTFGKLVYQLSRGTKLSLLGLHQVQRSPNSHINLGPLSIPVRLSRRPQEPDTSSVAERTRTGRIAMMLDSELDESLRIGGWVEMENSNPGPAKWAVSMSDTPENELGWGLSLGGIMKGPKNWDQLQIEGFLKLNLGEKFRLQPGFVYVMDGTSQVPALMLRSTCEF